MRVSPNGKSTGLKKPSKYLNKGTGVYGSRADNPPSTNVSSPIQAASRRRALPRSMAAFSNDEYVEDDFVVDDDSEDAFEKPAPIKRLQRRNERHAAHESSDDSDENFGRVREAGRPQRPRKRNIGPPITTDEKLENLNPIHREVVEGFMLEAKKESDKVSILECPSISIPVAYHAIAPNVQKPSSSAILNNHPP